MIDYLIDIDKAALLAVNGTYSAFQDALWWMVSAKWSSLLLVLAMLWVLLRKNWRHAILVIAMLVLAVILADQVSSTIIKALVERPRPTHDAEIQGAVHLVNGYRAGLYGFVSSHAANFFAVSTLVSLIFRSRLVAIPLYTWSLMQCYSRMYLGVHYPGDIIGGIAVGLLVGWFVWWIMKRIERYWRFSRPCYTRTDAGVIALSVIITVIVLPVVSLLMAW